MLLYMSIVVKPWKCSKTSLRTISASSEVTCLSPLTSAAAMITDHQIIWLLSPARYISSSEWKTGTLVMRYYQKECNE